MSKQTLGTLVLGVLILVGVASWPAITAADTLKSSSYQFDETSLGGGGLIQSSSANFQSAASIGDNAIGEATSANFQIESGHQTTADPSLTFTVNSASSFGVFSPTTAQTATSTFSVSNYTSYGYSVQIIGSPPSYAGHTITPMSSTGTSTPGTEQFGINLVANTSPSNVGANPVQTIFGAGVADANYNTANSYRYVSGETIASAPKSSGITTYTITYLINVKILTPGGQYTSNQELVCVATY